MLQGSTPDRKCIGVRVIADTVISLHGGVAKYEGAKAYTDPLINLLKATSKPFDDVFE